MNQFLLFISTIAVLWGSSTATNTNHYQDRTLQNDNRVKIFQEKNSIVVIEAESADRRRASEGSFWKFENNKTSTIPDFLGTGYVRFVGNYTTNTTVLPQSAALTYFINISHPGNYRLSIRSNKDNSNQQYTNNDCYVRMINYPGALGTNIKTYLPGAFNTWGYRTLLQFNENSSIASAEIPYYEFPARGVYRFVISGRSLSSYTFDRFLFFDNGIHKATDAESNDQRQSTYVFTKPPSNAWPTLKVPISSLPLLPYFQTTAQLPKYMFDTGIANETANSNGTMMIYGNSSIFTYADYDIIVLPEWKSQYESFGKIFQTHRSGGLNFAYDLRNLYPPGTLVNVTLGFAENYRAYCKTGRRVFNVTVNGKEFVSSLDVYGTVGCNVALLLSKLFQVNKYGNLVISFKSVKQNPMIAYIGIDSAAATTTTGDSVDTPSNILSDSPSDTPSNVASNVPSDLSSNTPSDTPSDASSSVVPSTIPTSFVDELLVDEDSVSVSSNSNVPAPSIVPSDTPSDVSSNSPSDVPSNVSSNMPSDVQSELSSNIPSDVQSFSSVSSIVPSDTPSEFSSSVPSDVPSDLSSNIPSDVQSDLSSNTPSGDQFDTISDVPSNFPSAVQSDTPSDSPSDMPSAAPLPIVGLNLVESESGAYVATIHAGDVIERSAIGMNMNLTVVVETLDVVETVRFLYDGITHIEGVVPYAMFGKFNGESKFWSVPYLSTNGLKTIQVSAYDIEYTKSIDEVVMTFTIV